MYFKSAIKWKYVSKKAKQNKTKRRRMSFLGGSRTPNLWSVRIARDIYYATTGGNNAPQCWMWTLFEASRALFMKIWKIYSTKTSRVLTVKAVLKLISWHLKNIWPTNVMQNRREVSCWRPCTAWNSRPLHEENQLRISNSKHSRFYWTKKHFISEWYFTKNHELGVLSWEKLKNRETHGRIVSLDQPGSRRAIIDLFVTFIAWRVKNLQQFVNVCPKVGYSANLKHSKSTWRQLIAPWKGPGYKIITSKALGTMHAQHFFSSWSRNGNDRPTTVCRFNIGCFLAEPTNYVRCRSTPRVTHLHIAVPTITCSLGYA